MLCRGAVVGSRRYLARLKGMGSLAWFHVKDSEHSRNRFQSHLCTISLEPLFEGLGCNGISEMLNQCTRDSSPRTDLRSMSLASLLRKARGMALRQIFQNFSLLCEAWNLSAGSDYKQVISMRTMSNSQNSL